MLDGVKKGEAAVKNSEEVEPTQIFFQRGEESWRGTGHEGMSLLQIARQSGAPIESDCSGAGSCIRCRVKSKSPLLSSPTSIELDRLGNLSHLTGERMACQARVSPREETNAGETAPFIEVMLPARRALRRGRRGR